MWSLLGRKVTWHDRFPITVCSLKERHFHVTPYEMDWDDVTSGTIWTLRHIFQHEKRNKSLNRWTWMSWSGYTKSIHNRLWSIYANGCAIVNLKKWENAMSFNDGRFTLFFIAYWLTSQEYFVRFALERNDQVIIDSVGENIYSRWNNYYNDKIRLFKKSLSVCHQLYLCPLLFTW